MMTRFVASQPSVSFEVVSQFFIRRFAAHRTIMFHFFLGIRVVP